MSKLCKELNKTYYIVEYGFDWYAGFDKVGKQTEYRKMTLAGIDADIPLMIIWNYAFNEKDVECSFDERLEFADYIFYLIKELNAEFESNNKSM